MTTDLIGPAVPLSHGERDWVAGEGTIGPAIAAMKIQWVYCECGAEVQRGSWHDHLGIFPRHNAVAVQREPDWNHDCMLILDEQAFVNPPGEVEWDYHAADVRDRVRTLARNGGRNRAS